MYPPPPKRRRGVDSPSAAAVASSYQHHRPYAAWFRQDDDTTTSVRGPALARHAFDARTVRDPCFLSYPPRDHHHCAYTQDVNSSDSLDRHQRWTTVHPARSHILDQRLSVTTTASPLPGLSQWLGPTSTDPPSSPLDRDHGMRRDDRVLFRQSTAHVRTRDPYVHRPRAAESPEPRLPASPYAASMRDSLDSVGSEALPLYPVLHDLPRRLPATLQLVRTSSSSQDTQQASAYPRARTLAKSSRYLREIDRRNILQRIESGEKQATLAKEYQVSRAAICNLNKHRDIVLSRKDENPLAKHPKKPRTKGVTANASRIKITTKASDMVTPHTAAAACTYEIKTRATALLLSRLRSPNTDAPAFRRYADRLLRLVLEEALALVPTQTTHVSLSETVAIDGVEVAQPTCGIALEVTGGTHLLRVFHTVEPQGLTGSIRLHASNQLDAVVLPSNLTSHNVFLLDLFTYSSASIATAIATLTSRGVKESSVWLVTLCVAYEVADVVHTRFPHVKIVAAHVDRTSMPTLPTTVEAVSSVTTGPPLTTTPDLPTKVLVKRFLQAYEPTRMVGRPSKNHVASEPKEVTI